MDETYTKVAGRWRYVYRAIDGSGALVDVVISDKRDTAAAKAFFRSAEAVTGITPDRVTTDGHASSPRAIRTEFRTDRTFSTLAAAQAELDDWVADYNTNRPHQALNMATPAQRFWRDDPAKVSQLRLPPTTRRPDSARGDGMWVSRRASAVGVVMVSWQQVCLGVAAAGHNIDVWVTDDILQFYDGDQLLRTQKRTSEGSVRVKRSTAPKRAR